MAGIKGLIGYVGLSGWWVAVFSDTDREYIEEVFQPLSTSSERRTLTEGDIVYTSETPVRLLTALLGWFKKPSKDEQIGLRIATKLDELASQEADALSRHFAYHSLLEWYYRFRDHVPGALDRTIVACEKQIAISAEAAALFRHSGSDVLPVHRGYEQLAIIREKQGRFEEAIDVSNRAMQEGWGSGWESRITRNRKKMAKQAIG